MTLKINALLTPELDLGELSASLLNSHGQTNILPFRSRFFRYCYGNPLRPAYLLAIRLIQSIH
jgi:hypothetical protein